MEIEQAVEFVRENHRAVLATRRRDGSIQMSPVAVGDDEAGRLVVSSRESAMKTLNIRRDPQVSLCVLSDAFFGRWIQVDGPAEVVSLPEAMDKLVEYYRRTSGEHSDWDDYRQAMENERRVMIEITITRAGPDRSG